ncbi:Segregation and condensation protein A [bioreactor metagenome]|uniref:Segregation and condensation protein A n=1 Tax=bioreactor metagenome TaxID=1076179 RepID=A0A645EDA6_9ZZZZ
MQGFEKAAALMYEKLPEEYPLPPPSFEISGLTLSGLISAFAAVMARTPKEEEPPADIARQIMREEHSVPDCMLRIGKLLKQGSIGFSALIGERPSKEEIVTYFLALLELLRLGRISITQDEAYGEIVLHPAKRRKQEHGD